MKNEAELEDHLPKRDPHEGRSDLLLLEARVAGRRNWWVFLIAGLAWLVISVIVLRFNIASVAAVGVLLSVLFLVAGVDEFLMASARARWRWAHILMGLLLGLAAIWALASPFDAFWALAAALGLILVFKGTFDVVGSVASRDVSELWWLGLTAGVVEILLGFWASQQLFPARADLLLVWVGFYAIFRGFSEIVIAFELRSDR